MEDTLAVLIPIVAILGGFGVIALKIVTRFLLEWRQAGSRQDVARLEEELAALRRDYEQTKADHNDTLLGLVSSVHRLEERLVPSSAGEVPPSSGTLRPPETQRQL